MEKRVISSEELAEICNARDVICKACGCIEYCDHCHVTAVVDDACNDCPEYKSDASDD